MCPREVKSLAQRNSAGEGQNGELDSAHFHGLFSVPLYLVKIEGEREGTKY